MWSELRVSSGHGGLDQNMVCDQNQGLFFEIGSALTWPESEFSYCPGSGQHVVQSETEFGQD